MTQLTKYQRSFEYVESQIRKKSFAILSTVSPNGWAQSTGIMYVVNPAQYDEFCIYIFSNENYKKVKNITANPKVSMVIPFPHHILQFVPASTVAFQAEASKISTENPAVVEAFHQSRITAPMFDNMKPGDIILKIKPRKRLHVYGLGIPLMKLRTEHEGGSYNVEIPASRI